MQLCRRRLIHLQKIVHKIYMFFFIYHVDLTVISLFPASLPALDNFFPAMHMQCHCLDKNAYLLHVLSSGPKHPYFPDDPDPDAKSSQILFSLRQCLLLVYTNSSPLACCPDILSGICAYVYIWFTWFINSTLLWISPAICEKAVCSCPAFLSADSIFPSDCSDAHTVCPHNRPL